MAKKTPSDKAELDQQDRVDERRDRVIKRMLNTTPKKHPTPKPGRKPGRPIH